MEENDNKMWIRNRKTEIIKCKIVIIEVSDGVEVERDLMSLMFSYHYHIILLIIKLYHSTFSSSYDIFLIVGLIYKIGYIRMVF